MPSNELKVVRSAKKTYIAGMAEDGKVLSTKFFGRRMPLPATRHTVLYKYFGPPVGDESFAEANLESLILGDKVRLSSNGEVNDPSDSVPVIAHDHSKKDLEKFFHRLLTNPNKDPGTESMRKVLAAQLKNRAGRKKYYKNNRESYDQTAVEAPARSFKSSGFTCMTEEWSNRLMWSHYAQSHKGICIGFRTRPVDDQAPLPFAGNFLEVKYITDRPIWSLKAMMDGENQEEVIKQALYRKDGVWAYEKEWRFTNHINDSGRMFKGGEIITIGSDEIVEVIFGMRASETTRKKVLDMLSISKKTPDIYNTDFAKKSFALQRVLVS